MHFLDIAKGSAVVELYPEDCLRLARACAAAADEVCGSDQTLLQVFEAYEAMFEAAATATTSQAYVEVSEPDQTETSLTWIRKTGLDNTSPHKLTPRAS